MAKKNIPELLRNYLSAKKSNKNIYLDPNEIEEILEYLKNSGKDDLYEEIIKLGLQLHPNNFNIKVKEARLYFLHEDYETAIDKLTLLKKEDPLNTDIDLFILECYCYLGKYEEVFQYVDTLDTETDNEFLEEVYEYIAPVINDLGDNQHARKFLESAMKLFPENQILHHETCYALEACENSQIGIEFCERLLDQNPYDYEFWFYLGRFHTLEGNFEKAIEAFDFAGTTSQEQDTELQQLKAYCLYMNGSYERAGNEYEALAQNKGTILQVAPLLMDSYIQQGRFDRAYQFLHPLIANDNKLEVDLKSYIAYIQCCLALEKDGEADALIKRLERKYKRRIPYICLLIEIAASRNDEKTIIKLFKKMAFEIFHLEYKSEEDGNAMLLLAKKLEESGFTRYAMAIGNAALRIHPNPPFDSLPMDSAINIDAIVQDFMQELQSQGKDLTSADLEDMLQDYLKKRYNLAFGEKKANKATLNLNDLAKSFLKDKNNSN